jgi:hypothetical protein
LTPFNTPDYEEVEDLVEDQATKLISTDPLTSRASSDYILTENPVEVTS